MLLQDGLADGKGSLREKRRIKDRDFESLVISKLIINNYHLSLKKNYKFLFILIN